MKNQSYGFAAMLAVVGLASLVSSCATRVSAPVSAGLIPPIAGAKTLAAFDARVAFSRARLPAISAAAEAAAARVVAHTNALITVPYADQPSFAEEILSRAGGLANSLPIEDRATVKATPNDILLFSVRSWEKDRAKALQHVAAAHSQGSLTVLFASRAGMPEGLQPEFIVDNGAAGGGEDEAPINAIANAMNAWLWSCEYAGALMRHGKAPPVLKSICLPDWQAHNGPITTPAGRLTLLDCDKPAARGALAGVYLQAVDRLARGLRDEPFQRELTRAADLIAPRMAAGGKVGVATCTHVAMQEIFLNNAAPWKPFNVVWQARTAFTSNIGRDDMLFWIGYVGMSTEFEDYAKYIRATKAPFVATYVPDSNPTNNAPDAAVLIPQLWRIGDAVVDVPFPPGRMAPVSGLNVGLLYRMLDEAVAERLPKKGE